MRVVPHDYEIQVYFFSLKDVSCILNIVYCRQGDQGVFIAKQSNVSVSDLSLKEQVSH